MESGRVGAGEQVEGVRIARSESGGVTRLRVDVLNERGERETGKRPGAPYDAKPTKAEGGKGKGPKPVIRVN